MAPGPNRLLGYELTIGRAREVVSLQKRIVAAIQPPASDQFLSTARWPQCEFWRPLFETHQAHGEPLRSIASASPIANVGLEVLVMAANAFFSGLWC